MYYLVVEYLNPSIKICCFFCDVIRHRKKYICLMYFGFPLNWFRVFSVFQAGEHDKSLIVHPVNLNAHSYAQEGRWNQQHETKSGLLCQFVSSAEFCYLVMIWYHFRCSTKAWFVTGGQLFVSEGVYSNKMTDPFSPFQDLNFQHSQPLRCYGRLAGNSSHVQLPFNRSTIGVKG